MSALREALSAFADDYPDAAAALLAVLEPVKANRGTSMNDVESAEEFARNWQIMVKPVRERDAAIRAASIDECIAVCRKRGEAQTQGGGEATSQLTDAQLLHMVSEDYVELRAERDRLARELDAACKAYDGRRADLTEAMRDLETAKAVVEAARQIHDAYGPAWPALGFGSVLGNALAAYDAAIAGRP